MILEQPIESLSDIPPEIRGTLSEDLLSFVARGTIDSYRANEQGVPSVIGEGDQSDHRSDGPNGRKPCQTLIERGLL
jgi:hypothetical protein